MTESNEHEHGPDCRCEEIPQQIREQYDEIFEDIRALPEEVKHLFIEDVLTKVKGIISDVAHQSDPAFAMVMLSAADNTLNLAGLANATISEDHEEWTSTGDVRIGAIWEKWSDVVHSMTETAKVMADDVPPEVLARFHEGKQTPEDLAILKDVIEKQTGQKVEDDAEVVFAGFVGEQPEKDKPTGTGLYL